MHVCFKIKLEPAIYNQDSACDQNNQGSLFFARPRIVLMFDGDISFLSQSTLPL